MSRSISRPSGSIAVTTIVLLLPSSISALAVQNMPAAGWYMQPSGDPVLVSPGPRGGYRRLDFSNASFGALLVGEGKDTFRWVPSGAGGPALVAPGGKRWEPWAQGPYDIEETFFAGADGVRLAALLLLPRRPTGRGAVIIHGSGMSDRDNVWAYTFANALASAGIAVVFPDKRGSGASGGDWREVGLDALAHDAVAAAEILARRTALEPRAIGWVGLSQGGWVAPLAARFSGRGAFVASISAAAVPVFDQIAFELENTLRAEGLDSEALAGALALQDLIRGYATGAAELAAYQVARRHVMAGRASSFAEAMPVDTSDWRWRWWSRVGPFDPVESWARADLPTLVMYGAQDESDNVPVRRSVSRLHELTARPGVGARLTCVVLPGVGHALVDPATKWVSVQALQHIVEFARAPTRRACPS
jgi:hypothetical protein